MPDELTKQTDTTLSGDSSVDASTSADEGTSAPLVPSQDGAAGETEEQKKERISQTEWKNMKDKVTKANEREALLKKTLGLKPEDDVDVVGVLQKQIADLKSDSLRKEFEAQIPIVKTDKYAEAWKNVVDAKQHLIQSGELTYEDLWKIIRDEGVYKSQTEAVQETQKEEQAASFGSVPFFGNSIASQESDKLTGMDKEIAKGMGWTEKNYQTAGVL